MSGTSMQNYFHQLLATCCPTLSLSVSQTNSTHKGGSQALPPLGGGTVVTTNHPRPGMFGFFGFTFVFTLFKYMFGFFGFTFAFGFF